MQDTDNNVQISGAWPQVRCGISSFDGGVRVRATLQRPDRYRFWDDITLAPRIARGAGLSYAAASFREDGLSIDHTAFDRVLDFDSKERVVEVESGISLATVLQCATISSSLAVFNAARLRRPAW